MTEAKLVTLTALERVILVSCVKQGLEVDDVALELGLSSAEAERAIRLERKRGAFNGDAGNMAAPEPVSDPYKLDVLPLGTPVEVDFKEAEVGRKTLYVAGVTADNPNDHHPSYWLSETWPVKCRGDVSDGWDRSHFTVSAQPLSNTQELDAFWDAVAFELLSTRAAPVVGEPVIVLTIVQPSVGADLTIQHWARLGDIGVGEHKLYTHPDPKHEVAVKALEEVRDGSSEAAIIRISDQAIAQIKGGA